MLKCDLDRSGLRTYKNSGTFGVGVEHHSPLFWSELWSIRAQAVEQLPVLLRSFVVLILQNHQKITLNSISQPVNLFV